jgi:hypothetical protein
MRGVESIDDVGLDPPMCGGIKAVLAGGGDPLCHLDVRSEHRFDLVGIGGSKINPIIGTLIGEGDFVSQSVVDRFSIEIVDKLANNDFGHREPSSLYC